MPRPARIAVAAVFLASGASLGTWVSRVPALQHKLDASKSELGLALFGLAVGAVVGLPLAGWLAHRFGSRRVTRTALLGVALTMPLPGLAPSLLALGLCFAAFGMASGILDVAMNAHGVEVEGLYGRPILSSFHAAFSIGGLAGAAAGGVAGALGVSPALHFALAGAAFAIVWAWTGPRLLPRALDRASDGLTLRALSRGLLAVAALTFAAMLTEGAVADWGAVYLHDVVGTTQGVATIGFIAFSVTMTLGRLVGDRLTARLGPVALTRSGGLLAALGVATALVIKQPAVVALGFACLGAGVAVVVPMAYRAADVRAAAPGIAAVSTVGYRAFLIGPPLIGFLADATSLTAALSIVVGLCLAIALLAPATR